MKIYRCLICGDTFVQANKPSRCPYCGSSEEYIVETEVYPSDINAITPTTQEAADLIKACQLEYANMKYYSELGAIDPHDGALPSLYRHLAKIEREHLSVFSKLLKMPSDSIEFQVGVPIPAHDWSDDIMLSSTQEVEARDFYTLAANRASNPRIAQVFTAIAAVEQDHIVVDEEASRRLIP